MESTGTEPVSGRTGNTAAGEPYDAGNMSGVLPEESNLSTSASNLPVSAAYPSDTTKQDPARDLSAAPIQHELSSAALPHQAPDLNRGSDTPSGRADNTTASKSIMSGHGVEAGANAVSSAGARNIDKATEHAGGMQGEKSGSSGVAAAAGPPAPELIFKKKEIDEAANVYKSHENPHTIAADGREESLEEVGSYKNVNEHNKKGHRVKEKSGMGAKLEALKDKLHHHK